jgi:hypothetical protein
MKKAKDDLEAEELISEVEFLGQEIYAIAKQASKRLQRTLKIVDGYLKEASE